jgi:hypothetical protein
MSSIIRVDTLQKPDGSTPTAADLGIDVSAGDLPAGTIVQTQYVTPCRQVSGWGATDNGIYLTVSTWTTPTHGTNPYQITYNATLPDSKVRVTVSGTTHGVGSAWVGLHQDRILSTSGNTYTWPQWRQGALPSDQNHTSFYLTKTFDSSILDGHTIQYQIMPHPNASSSFLIYEDLIMTVEEIAQ